MAADLARPDNAGMGDPHERQLWLTPRQGEPHTQRVADVALRVGMHRLACYRVPDELVAAVTPGVLVEVPVGTSRRVVTGWCVDVADRPWDSTRQPILATLPTPLVLPPSLRALALWVADYYAAPPGRVIEAILPSTLRQMPSRGVRLIARTAQTAPDSLSPRRKAVLELLAGGPMRRSELVQRGAASPALIRGLVKLGLARIDVQREPAPRRDAKPSAAEQVANGPPPESSPEDSFTLTPSQQDALGRIESLRNGTQRFRVVVLFGIPGSGKTEVYVRAIRSVVSAGEQALLIVPEIALATQIEQRLSRRFGRLAVLHSGLTPAARRDLLLAIAAGGIDVVLGTRTAVFAPLPRLGLIVVDEEQETSFKNLASPYFHARDVAIKRGQIENVPVVLGSATPSLETWHNAATLPHYERVDLPERVPGARLPIARAIDASRTELGQTTRVLMPEMLAALRDTVQQGEQAVLLHNRRGYAVHLRCTACGMVVRCTRCGANMVLHRRENQLKCHRCGARGEPPQTCLDQTCGGRLERTGLAIQRLEEELERELPGVRIVRMDSDEMKGRGDYDRSLRLFADRQADILIGTQMVAKGLDFPGVRLVGVVGADEMLRIPDFRAAERTFQLLVQVVGRAGRREGESLALIQTSETTSPAIRHALRVDYEAFARDELPVRRALSYPPYGRLVRILCLDERGGAAREAAREIAAELRRRAGRIHADLRVHDAEPCPIARLREMLRWQVIVRSPAGGAAQRLIHEALDTHVFRRRIRRVTIDVDPTDLL